MSKINVLEEIANKYKMKSNDYKWIKMIIEEIDEKNHEIKVLKIERDYYKKLKTPIGMKGE